MAEIQEYGFSYKEVVEALIKQQGLHEGVWMIRVEFALAAANIKTPPAGKELAPAAIVPMVSIGLQRGEEPNNLSVDAAEVNPAPNGGRKKAPRASKASKKGEK